ncbi:hypothetical protein ACFSQ7_12525 [Paenibacillus rhizoplanae]
MLAGQKMKYLVVLSAVMILCGILIGCSSKKEGAKDVPVHTIEEHIKQAASMENMEKKWDMNRLKKLYHLDADEVQDFCAVYGRIERGSGGTGCDPSETRASSGKR